MRRIITIDEQENLKFSESKSDVRMTAGEIAVVPCNGFGGEQCHQSHPKVGRAE